MKRNIKNISLIILLLILSGCPYKEIYKPINEKHLINGLDISPVILFFNSHKGISTCAINLKFRNQNDSIQKVTFSKSYLINLKDTLEIENIYAWMVPLSPDHVFYLPSKKDTALQFMFKDGTKIFGDSLKFLLEVSGFGKTTFIYKKNK